MSIINLEFRAKIKGKWFYQKDQYLTSFLRRVLLLLGVSHPKYLKENLEGYLQIKINNKWVQCYFKEVK
jgi:hypothetical protein